MNKVIKTFQYGEQTVTLETGRIARQASGAVLASMGDTTVMASVVAKKESSGLDFLPLTVEVEERNYAAGRIPGGFFKREGKPSEKAVLTCRLIDRPIRPLFPKGYNNETQIIITVLSIDPKIDYDIVSMLASSAALYLSGCPFQGPIGSACVGYVNGDYVLNPNKDQLAESDLELVVAGTEDAVLMVESEASQLSEEVMLGAVMFGYEQQQDAIKAIKEFAEEAGRVAWDYEAESIDADLVSKVEKAAKSDVEAAYAITEKQARVERLSEIKESVVAEVAGEDENIAATVKGIFKALESDVVRGGLLDGKPRIDGRDTETVRPINIETSVLPRTHGSALFTRGETQALVVTTLGTARDAQIIDALDGEYKDDFIFHYNFPPYSVGEAGRVGVPKRREIGHGRLAKRGVIGVLPDGELPYTLRVVSEITESNGSSSMASVCGASLSLMDAGIKLKAPVAGVAMGLIKEGDRFAILTDILGDEDHLGDMDFKVAGSKEGITALQMDIKINGITHEIMQKALDQAKDGRLHILSEMEKVISEGRDELSEFAPRITTMKINPDKIRDVIGKGGSVIRQLCEETGATIDIEDDGTIKIAATSGEQAADAQQRIEAITAEVEEGNIYKGKVVRIADFGAFVNILPGQDGLVHISQIAKERVNKVDDYLEIGQEVDVKVLEVDRQGKVRLSIKALLEDDD